MAKKMDMSNKDMVVTLETISQRHLIAHVMFSKSMHDVFGDEILKQIMDISDKYINAVKNIIEDAVNKDEDMLDRYVKRTIKETSPEHIKRALDIAEGKDKEYIEDVIKEMAADEDKEKKNKAKSILKDIKKGR